MLLGAYKYIGMAQKDRGGAEMEKAIHSCAVCSRDIERDNLIARRVDSFWVCSTKCVNKLLKEKKMWTPKGWDELGKIQALYDERKRAGITATCR